MSRTYTASSAMFFGKDRSILPVTEVVASVARRLFPNKTARNLASRAGTTHRAAEFWLAQHTGMSAEALAEILRSDIGRDVLEGIMGEARPSWWPAFKADLLMADLERREADNRAAIEELRREIDARRAR